MLEAVPAVLAAATVCLAALAIALLRPAWIVEHPRTVLGLVALASLGAVVALVRLDPPGLTIDVDPASEPLIATSDPGIPVYAQATDDFGSDDVYVIAMETEAGVFTRENLQLLRELTHRLRGLPGIAEVESVARVPYIRWDAESDVVSVDRFMREVPETDAAIATLRRQALGDPVYRKTLISADGLTAAINITFQPMSDRELIGLDLDGRIQALLAESNGAGRRFYISGRPHVRSQTHHIIVSDLVRLVPIAVVIAAFTLWLMSGSTWGVLIPLLSCLCSTLWVYGAMAVLRVDINVITLVIGPMMICIGSVYGVHVYARYQVFGAGGGDARAVALACLEYARAPVAMAGLTTCIGFGALLLTDTPATYELGAFAIFGIAGVTVLSLTAVPAALVLLAPAADGAGAREGTQLSRWFGARLDALLAGVARLAVGRPQAVLLFWGALTLGALASIPRIQIDTDFITFFLEDSRVRTDFDDINRLLVGTVPIYVLVSGQEEGAFRDPGALGALERLQAQIEALEGVSQVLSSVDLIRLANEALARGDETAARIPDTREAAAEATFLIPKSKLRRFATSNHSRANLIVRTGQAGSASVRALEARIQAVLDAAELPPGFATEVTGNAILLNRGADGVANSQATQVGFAALAILSLIVAVFRSLRVGLISMVPNIVPVLLFFGVLGLGAAPLSLPTSLIGSIALGIAIDDTAHFLVAYQARRRDGSSSAEAAARTIAQVGRPIAMTSVMLVVGFLVILASGFATLREFGTLTALTMGICLTTDLLLLPALLVRLKA